MIRILKLGETPMEEILSRNVPAVDVGGAVSNILEDVRKHGDEALFRYAEQFDRVRLAVLEVTEDEISEAFAAVEPAFLEVLRGAAANIRAFHEKQVRSGFMMSSHSGALLGQRVIPVEKVGLYVPGGTAAYPSTVLMDAIPAQIAGCREICIATPPNRQGKISPAVLAAAKIAGVTRIFKMGGAQAIAALAFGTESVPKVDKIVGPGNAYVAEAKRQVFGMVSIDMIAGPSEILIVADEKSDAAVLAADLLSQAEHDKMATAVLVTDSEALANQVAKELDRQLPLLPRMEIARASVEENGKIILTEDIETAIEVANRLAPEHLELCLDDPFRYFDAVRNAGSVFLGRYCPEALGDYFAGPNHTLPTSGTARFSSPLSVDDFVKKSQYIYYTKEALDEVAQGVARFAEQEGLQAHARSAVIRFEEERR